MKKSLILAAALVLVATSAMATSIVGSAHDLNAAVLVGGTNPSAEVCVFCHTPHAALLNANAPLWNRTLGTTTFTYYNSATLSTFSKSTVGASLISNSIATSDAVLCLTCHDGASLTDGLVNPPNAGAPVWGTYTMGANANIGNDLSNDHPIGMVYDNVQTGATDAGGFVASAGGLTVGALNLYNGRMWCSSCHDVHNNDYAPFLATSNAASALCVTCHIK